MTKQYCTTPDCENQGERLVRVEECNFPICKSAVEPNGYTLVGVWEDD